MTRRMVEDEGEPSSMSRGKGKQKRPPQRGLGVAQLEKIRLEEQHKNSNAAASSSSSPPPPPPCSQPLPLPLNPIVDLSSSTPSFPNHTAAAAGIVSGPRGFLAKWIDQRSDGNPLGLMSRRPSLPRVNSMVSPTASGFCFHMEPPSSQIFYHSHTSHSSSSSSSSWQEDDRAYRTGKRPCENMQNLSPYKIPSVSGSFVRAAYSPLVYRNLISSSYQVDLEQNHAALHVHQTTKENCFLTLGNRAPLSTPIRTEISNQYQESVDHDHDTSSYVGSSGPNTSSPYYTFLPLATDVQKEKDIGDCEETKSLDLNLKL